MTVAYVSVHDLPDKLLAEMFPDKRDKRKVLWLETQDRVRAVEDIVSKAIKSCPPIIVDYHDGNFEVLLDTLEDRDLVRGIVETALSHVGW